MPAPNLQSWLQTPQKLTSPGLAFIQQLGGLRTLSLERIDLTGATGLAQCSLPELRRLCLACARTDEAVVTALVQCQLPRLRHLDLGYSKLTVPSLYLLAQGKWPLLTSLHIGTSTWWSQQHSQDAFDPLARSDWPLLRQLSAPGWTQLKSFEASHMLGVANVVIAGLTCIKLKRVTVACIDNLVAMHWPSLRSLTISTDHDFAILSAVGRIATLGTWPLLETLVLSHNLLNGNALSPLRHARWPLLRKLHLASSTTTVCDAW